MGLLFVCLFVCLLFLMQVWDWIGLDWIGLEWILGIEGARGSRCCLGSLRIEYKKRVGVSE